MSATPDLSVQVLISAYAQFDWGPTHAHNALFESALDVGIPMTIVFGLFLFRSIVRATDHVRWVRGPIGLFPLVYLTMVVMTVSTKTMSMSVSLCFSRTGADQGHRADG